MESNLALVTYQDIEKRKRFESFAENAQHYLFIHTDTKSKQALCSCGWTGTSILGGVARAWTQWRKHVIDESVQVSVSEGVGNLKKS